MSLLTNLVAYWKLDESSGTRADAHSSYDLTAVNSPGSTTGKLGDAVALAAASSQYLSSAASALQVGTGSISFACWLRVSSLSAHRPVATKGAGNDMSAANATGYNLQIRTTGEVMSVFGDAANSTRLVNSSGVGEILTDTTYHLAYVIDRAAHEARVYKNTSLILTQDISSRAGDCSSSSNFHLGANSSVVNCLDGWIDECGVWSRALTAPEVTTLYNSGNGLAYPFATGSLFRSRVFHSPAIRSLA